MLQTTSHTHESIFEWPKF